MSPMREEKMQRREARMRTGSGGGVQEREVATEHSTRG